MTKKLTLEEISKGIRRAKLIGAVSSMIITGGFIFGANKLINSEYKKREAIYHLSREENKEAEICSVNSTLYLKQGLALLGYALDGLLIKKVTVSGIRDYEKMQEDLEKEHSILTGRESGLEK